MDSFPVIPTDEIILILDFGAQYTQLIARRIRECGVYCEILPYTVAPAQIKARRPRGMVLSGGPSSVYEPGAPMLDPLLYDMDIPILGICYGHQVMAHQLGGNVVRAPIPEYGSTRLELIDRHDLLADLPDSAECWMSHGDIVMEPPVSFTTLARTSTTPVAAMADENARLYGVQFHPEVIHTPYGKDVLNRYVRDICGCAGRWSPGSFISESIDAIRERVGDGRVVCGVSGGIDSCAVAALVHRAIEDRLTCVFVDHGLLRQGEADEVRRDFADALGIHLISVDAAERFLSRLVGVLDPEKKRKIIGEEFVRVFEEIARTIHGASFLAQGTLYPDVIESGVGHAATIKTHHNVGGLPETMGLQVIEPLRYLFKDEVRAVAKELGLPDSIVWRHPFPGPGLAVRIVGEVNRDNLRMVRQADAIFLEELRASAHYHDTWQAFAALLPGIRSVGVMGDDRTYAHPIILRAVVSDDAMTADWARLPYDLLQKVSNRITNEVKGINRVVYDISSKPPATIEWE